MGSGSVFVFGNCHPHCLNYSFTTWRVGRPGVAWVLALLLDREAGKNPECEVSGTKTRNATAIYGT